MPEPQPTPDMGQSWRVDDWDLHRPAGLTTELAKAEWLHDWVLIQRLDLDAETRPKSPIKLVKFDRKHGEEPAHEAVLGLVVAVGPGERTKRGREAPDFTAGVRVLYEDFAAQPYAGDGAYYDVVRVHHVLAEVE
jgi:co-chaperonin GroES (HSP10)